MSVALFCSHSIGLELGWPGFPKWRAWGPCRPYLYIYCMLYSVRRIRRMQYFIIKFVGGQSLICFGVCGRRRNRHETTLPIMFARNRKNEKSKANVWAANYKMIYIFSGFWFRSQLLRLNIGVLRTRLTRLPPKICIMHTILMKSSPANNTNYIQKNKNKTKTVISLIRSDRLGRMNVHSFWCTYMYFLFEPKYECFQVRPLYFSLFHKYFKIFDRFISFRNWTNHTSAIVIVLYKQMILNKAFKWHLSCSKICSRLAVGADWSPLFIWRSWKQNPLFSDECTAHWMAIPFSHRSRLGAFRSLCLSMILWIFSLLSLSFCIHEQFACLINNAWNRWINAAISNCNSQSGHLSESD